MSSVSSMPRIRLGLIFGGRSVEHQVSLVSARAVLTHLDPQRYTVIPIGVTRDGRWLTASSAAGLLDEFERHPARPEGQPAFLTGDPSLGGLLTSAGPGAPIPLDVVFPMIHGTGGEDGTLQGLLDLADLPYVGSGVLGSSLGMDKAAMKTIFETAGLAQTPYLTLSRSEVQAGSRGVAEAVAARIGYPCFIKPSNGGSSVGVVKVKAPESLSAALSEALMYDHVVLVERAVDGQEVETAVLGNEAPEASPVGEIVPSNEFYDYNAKYLDDRSELIIPARVTPAQADQVRAMAVKAFRLLSCSGLARVDFFIRRQDGAPLINEINTLPGFTPISMYPRLWGAAGMKFEALVDRLVGLAFERHEARRRLRRDFAPAQKAPGER